MIILGKHSDDIGCQLERLTRKILEHKGYTDIVVNEISSGALEIDVTANFVFPLPGNPQSKRLICECKAHRTPISLPDWLKFLGKLYVEEARTNSEVSGLFVSLSGINGNVSGNFHELTLHRDNMSILTGDQLLQEITDIYKLLSHQEIIKRFEQLTARKYSNIEVAYYEEMFYWIFAFPNGEYAVLSSEGTPLSNEDVEETRSLIEQYTSLSQLIDLRKEAALITRMELLEKFVICSLVTNNGTAKIDHAQKYINSCTYEEYMDAIEGLRNKEWIRVSGDNLSFGVPNNKKQFYHLLSEILKFFFQKEIPIDLFIDFFTSKFLNRKINKTFIKMISKIQGDLQFSDDLMDLSIKIIKISPSALLYSITPDPMIVTHRTKNPKIVNDEFDEFDRRIFKRGLFKQLSNDFEQAPLKEYFYETIGIREIENIQKVLIKSKSKLEIQEEYNIRMGIGAADQSIGGGYISILLLDNAPQPWEILNDLKDKK